MFGRPLARLVASRSWRGEPTAHLRINPAHKAGSGPAWNDAMTAVARSHGPWLLIGILGAVALGIVASERGEHVNALWIVVGAVAVYLIGYRYYSLFIARQVMQLDPARPTPAVLHNDGL